MKTILLVEDDITIRKPLEEYLTSQGFKVLVAGLLSEAKEKLKDTKQKVDCLILDWNLPDGEGIELARSLNQRAGSPPVLMLTARTDLIDKVVGLEVGAHDYMTKPYEPRELLARVRNLMRLSKPGAADASDMLDLHKIKMDLKARTVHFNGKTCELTKMEFDLLKLFLENPGKVFSRDELLNLVWGYDQFPSTRTVDTHVLQLRNQFGEDLIETVRRVGYRCKK